MRPKNMWYVLADKTSQDATKDTESLSNYKYFAS